MPDPFSFTDPMTTKPFLGDSPTLTAPLLTQRSVTGSMLAPKPLAPTIASPAPAQPPTSAPATQPQHPATAGGVDQFMQLVRAHESGGNDKASSGVADGRYQFTPATWAGVAKQHPELGLQPNDIWDGAKQDLAMRAISKDYVNVLETNGIQPSIPNMFMLHFLGTGGGPKFLKQMQADPNANAAALFPLEAKYNPTIFHDKAGQSRSLQQVYALMTKTFGGPPMNPAMPAASDLKGIDTFDKAAGVPTAVRGFTDQAQQPVANEMKTPLEETPVSGLKPLPGMTPIKPALKPLPGMTPIGDGLKLDYSAKEPLKPPGGHTDENGNYHPAETSAKPDAPAPEVIGVDPTTGMPVFADPKLNAEEAQGLTETAKGFAAGVAQDVTGPASLLPNSLGGGYAEKANEYLDKTGDPAARVAGNIAPMAIPAGEIFGAAKAGAKALEAGESLLSSFGKAVGTGAATGALGASSNPTGKEGYGERLAAKAPGMIESGAVGGLISGAVPGVGAAAQWLGGEAGSFGKFITDAFGKEAKKAAEELRTGVSAKTGEAMTAEEQKIATAKLEEGAAKAKQAMADAELKRITDAQAQLEERERVRAAQNRDVRQADDPEAAAKLRAGVTVRARERVRLAEEQAKSAGATEEQAKQYAVEQEQKVLDAKTAAQEIAALVVKEPTMSKERFGEIVQKAAADMETKAEEAREVAADFKGAMQTAPPGPVVKNAKVFRILDDIDASSADRSVHAITAEVRKQFQTWRRDAEGNWEVADKDGITVERADSLRKVLNTALRSRKMAVEGGSADASAAQHHIGKVLDALEDATGEAHPLYNKAVKTWRDNSRGPLDQFLPKQALGKITKTEDFSGRFAMNEGRVVSEILSQSNQGSEALAVLARENPEVREAAESYLDREFQNAMGGKPTVEKIDKFLTRNESTLKKLEIYRYVQIRDTLASAGEQVKGAEIVAKDAKSSAAQAEAQRKSLDETVKKQRSLLERSKTEQPGEVFSPGAAKPKVDPYAGRTDAVKAETKVESPGEIAAKIDDLIAHRSGVQASSVKPEQNAKALDKVVAEMKKLLSQHVDSSPSVTGKSESPGEIAAKINEFISKRDAAKTETPDVRGFDKMGAQLKKMADEGETETGSRTTATRQTAKDKPAVPRTPDEIAKVAADKAKADAKRLREAAKDPKAARDQAIDELTKAASNQKAAQDVQKHIAELENKLDPSVARTGQEVTAESNKTADYLFKQGYLDAEGHKDLLAKIREVEQKNTDHTKAAKLAKIAIINAVIWAYPSYEFGKFVSHRFSP